MREAVSFYAGAQGKDQPAQSSVPFDATWNAANDGSRSSILLASCWLGAGIQGIPQPASGQTRLCPCDSAITWTSVWESDVQLPFWWRETSSHTAQACYKIVSSFSLTFSSSFTIALIRSFSYSITVHSGGEECASPSVGSFVLLHL